MSAKLKHTLRSRRGADILLKVYPHDGRSFEDRYFVQASEMRRFAWAVLADLDPTEAAHAAHEAGQDLEELCGLDFPLPRPGTFKRRILEALKLNGPLSTMDLVDAVPPAAPLRALLSELVLKDFVQQHLEGPHPEVRWKLTPRALRGLAAGERTAA